MSILQKVTLTHNSRTLTGYFVNSNNISVYPCAYRDISKYDKESRLLTEANLITVGRSIAKVNYISKEYKPEEYKPDKEDPSDPGQYTLNTEFYINGYSFKIKGNFKNNEKEIIDKIFDASDGTAYTGVIILRSLATDDDTANAVPTNYSSKVLGAIPIPPISTENNVLDCTINNESVFCGLLLASGNEEFIKNALAEYAATKEDIVTIKLDPSSISPIDASQVNCSFILKRDDGSVYRVENRTLDEFLNSYNSYTLDLLDNGDLSLLFNRVDPEEIAAVTNEESD